MILFPSRSSLPINLHVPSIASSSAILRVPKMCSTSFSVSVTGAFSRCYHTTNVHRQRCHYPCDRKRWKNPHGVSPKVIRREYPLLVFILVSPSYSVTLFLLHGNRR